MPTGSFRFTPEIERRAIELYRSGWTAKDIADLFGCDANTVSKKIRNLGLSRKDHPDARGAIATDERVKELIDTFDSETGSNTDVAKRMGVTRNVIIGHRHRNGFGPGREIILRLARKYPHATAREIAEATGRDRAPQILILNNEPREQGSLIRRELVARMRAELAREPV